MKKFQIILLLALCLGIFHPSKTTAVTNMMEIGGNIFTSPLSGEVWKTGSTYQIKWDKTALVVAATSTSTAYASQVDITIQDPNCSKGMPCIAIAPYSIAASAPNTGEFLWNIPNDLNSRYLGNQTIQVSAAGSTSYTSNIFTISNSNTTTGNINITSPQVGTTWQVGNTYNIQWTAPATLVATQVRIELAPYIACLYSTPACKIMQPEPYYIGTTWLSNNSFSWTIPTTQPLGSYVVSVHTLDNGLYGTSGVFAITNQPSTETLYISTADSLTATTGKSFRATFKTNNPGNVNTWTIQGQLPAGLTFQTLPSQKSAVSNPVDCTVATPSPDSGSFFQGPCMPVYPSNSAEITGVPTQTGSFPITISAKDNAGRLGQNNFTIIVKALNSFTLKPASVIRTPDTAVHLILDNNQYYTFTSWQEYIDKGYRRYNIRFLTDSSQINELNKTNSFYRPSGTIFKYDGDRTIYYLTRERCKQIYGSWNIYRLWGQVATDAIFMPKTEEFPTCSENLVKLPEGAAITNGGKTVFIYQNGYLRPVASWAAFLNLGYSAKDIFPLTDGDIQGYKQGTIIN